MDADTLLTSAEAARLLRVHPKHLYRLLRQGLPGQRVGRGHWRFDRTALLAWLEGRGRTGHEGGVQLQVRRPPGGPASTRWFVARVAGRWVGHPVRVDHAHTADAFVTSTPPGTATVGVSAARSLADLSANILVAGCAPLLGTLLDRLEHGRPRGRMHWLSTNSTAALRLLSDGFVHMAGIHLAGGSSGSDHVAIVRRRLPRQSCYLVHLVQWRQGLAVATGNPKGITEIADLGREDVRLAVRERGSGARRVLDRALRRAGVKRKEGTSDLLLADHRSVAQAVCLGAFDAGVTVESAAAEAGLGFIPLADEGFDLVVPIDSVDESGMVPLLEALDSNVLRREVSSLGRYDASMMGHVQTVAAR